MVKNHSRSVRIRRAGGEYIAGLRLAALELSPEFDDLARESVHAAPGRIFAGVAWDEFWWETASRRIEFTASPKQSIPPSGRDAKDVNIGVAHDVFGSELSKPAEASSTRGARTAPTR